MSFIRKSNRLIVLIALLVVFSAVLSVLGVVPLAEAATCTHGATKWVKIGCCVCNYETNKRLYVCDNGVWKATNETLCFYTGACCSTPCCF